MRCKRIDPRCPQRVESGVVIPAEALARALHPERDHRVGDWGARPWSTMKTEWRKSAVEDAARTISCLHDLGFNLERQKQAS